MLYSEDDLIPLSALQHLDFCQRQCALIHVEGVWAENRYTAEGRLMHERADEGPTETRGDVRIERGVLLKSLALGLSGKADIIEFHSSAVDSGAWYPYPVEYKRGKKKAEDCDRIQLCAQAICLEEMLGISIGSGALFYGKTRRREDVAFGENLRLKTLRQAQRLHELIKSGTTPAPVITPKCDNCSLINLCMPRNVYGNNNVEGYLTRMLET